MSSNKSIIFCAFLVFVLAKVNGNLKPFTNVVEIHQTLCDHCESSSYQSVIIGGNTPKPVVSLAVPSNSYFFIMQVHNHLDVVQFSYDYVANQQNSVLGTNIGLNQLTENTSHVFYLHHNFTIPHELLIAVTSYSKSAPMPGGCNMEFNTKTAPYQNVTYNDALITVDVQSASVDQGACDVQGNITLDFYQVFVEDNDLSLNAKTIIQMLTVDSIKAHGHKVVQSASIPALRRLFNNYQGFGVVYAVIASYGNESAAYVPALTYGCNMHNGQTSCFDNNLGKWNVIKFTNAGSYILLLTPLDAMVPFYNFLFFGIDAIFMASGASFTSTVLYCVYPFILCVSILFGIYAKIYQIDNIVRRIYLAHVTVAVVYMITATGTLEFCQSQAHFWILYVVFLVVMMAPVMDKIAEHIILFFHLSVWIDWVWAEDVYLYINVNAVRRVAVPNFYSASVYAPNLSVGVNIFLGIWAFVYVVVLGYSKYRNRSETPETRPLLEDEENQAGAGYQGVVTVETIENLDPQNRSFLRITTFH